MINSSHPSSFSPSLKLHLQYSQRSDNAFDESSFHDWHMQIVGAGVGDSVGWFAKAHDIVTYNANENGVWSAGKML